MCIAILNTKSLLPKSYIKNSWENNYHGAGFAYSKGDSMFVYKTDDNADTFYKVYKSHRKQNPDAKFLIHFRISTHGTITEDNLHPFIINDKIALIHNGTVDLKDHSYGDKRSDTRFLCEEILAKLPDGWHLSEGVHTFIKEIGGWSKFVLLDLDNNHAIIKESEGHWDDKGNWFSNSSYKSVSSYIDYGGTKVKRGSSKVDPDTSYGRNLNSSTSSWGEGRYLTEDNTKDASIRSLSTTNSTESPLINVQFEHKEGLVSTDLTSVFRVENFLHSKGLTKPNSSTQTKRYAVCMKTTEDIYEYISHLNWYAKGSVCDLYSWYYVAGKSDPSEYGAVVLDNCTVFGLGGKSGSKMCLVFPAEITDLYLIGKILRSLNAAHKASVEEKGTSWFQSAAEAGKVVDAAITEYCENEDTYSNYFINS